MIKFSDIELAFLFVSSDQPEMNSAAINKKTGEIYYQSDFTDTDEFPEDVDSEDYIYMPHKNDLDLGRDLVFDFAAKHLPQKTSEVNRIFSERGAYRRFKELLDSIGSLETWYNFEDEQTKKALREWCKENGLEFDE